MRVGQNPVKGMESVAQPAPVTVVVISHIPFLAGYYAQSLEVMKRCLGSLAAHTKGEIDLMVFDNGSCAEVREWLLGEQAAGRVQFLTLAERNIGKAGAWNLALAAAPGEVVVYADSDVYFYPGWLEPHLEALDLFPEAGMVTGMPILTPEKYSTATVKWAQGRRGVRTERGQLIGWEDFWRHAASLGDNEEEARRFFEANEAVRITRKDARYYVGAAHFQFAAPRAVLQGVLPIPAERPMGRVRLLDEMVNAKGYLRLSTTEWYVRHMGNTLEGFESEGARVFRRTRRDPKFRPLRKLLQWLYDRIFHILYRN